MMSSDLLGCGASKTMCGKEWLTQYVNNLNDEDQQVPFRHSNHIYRFGDGRKIESIHSAKISAIIGSHKFDIVTDFVASDISLLFLKLSMKRANMKLNFQDNTITIFSESIPLITSPSRHDAIPIIKPKQLINNLDRETNMPLTLTFSDSKDNLTITLKLHR